MIDVKRFFAASIKVKLPQQKTFEYANCAPNNRSYKTHCFVAFVGSHAYVNIIVAHPSFPYAISIRLFVSIYSDNSIENS